ncbi:MAG: type II toxin-antitoxin system VapB family antitoxin [Bdellovibrionota bacterium]
MAKQSINMRLDKDILDQAKKVLGQKETTATVEMALRNIINNRKAIEIFRKTAGKSKWEGFTALSDEHEEA